MSETNKKIAMIFPGQGAQYLGMGKELYDSHRVVQEYFEEASSCLENNFVRLCFASSEKELRETINAQTAIFLLSSSIFMLLKEKYGITPDIVAGHSSGEYAAIFAAGGMSFPDALYLLKKRAQFMDEATKTYQGSMMAVLGLSFEQLQEICRRYDNPKTITDVAEIVNYNSSTQLVVSGTLHALEQVSCDVKSLGGKVIMLNVAGAFHSRLMQEAEKQFGLYMVKVDFKDLSIPLINNVEAKIVTTNEGIKKSLQYQISSPVLWWPSMQQLEGCDVIIEVGPNQLYSKMLKREWPDKEIISINSLADIENLLIKLGKSIARTVHTESCNKDECAEEEIIVIEDQSQLHKDTSVIESQISDESLKNE